MSTATTVAALVLSVSAISSVQAQQPAPTSQSPEPTAASSPHQRDVTGRQSTEAPTGTSTSPAAASTPHQQEAASEGHGGRMAMAMADHEGADPASFVKKAGEGGLAEVAFAKAAKATSQDPKIKAFADQMLRDHGKANDELKTLAQSKGMQVPTELDSKHQAVLQKLSHEKGTEFDKAYTKQMQMDHEKTIALFRGAEQSKDPDLAAFAKKTLPTLTEHERMANSLPGASRTANADSRDGMSR